MNKRELQFLLDKYNVTPRKQQGQNFLIDDQVIQDTIDAARLTTSDTVVEIGPGFGVLTMALAETAGKVITIEQDRDIFPAVQEIAKQYPNVEPHNSDIRTFRMDSLGLQDGGYDLIANLPYSITSWILRHFLENSPKPRKMVVMVQKEVAERVCAAPGKMSILANAVQLYAKPSIVRLIPADSFHPAPKVESAILQIDLLDKPAFEHPEQLMRTVRIGFAAKRKQLHNSLSAGYQKETAEVKAALQQANIPETARPQELSLKQWDALRTVFEGSSSDVA